MKAMLEKLLGRENISPKPKDNTPAVAPEKPSFDQLELTEAAIVKRYPYSAFSKMLPDIEEHPAYGAKLLNTLISHQALFERYIRHFKQLKQLIELCPTQIDTIMNNVMMFSDSRETFFHFFHNHIELTDHYPAYTETFVDFAFCHEEVRKHWFGDEFRINRFLERYPERTMQLMDFLVNDFDFIKNTVKPQADYYFELCQDYPEYTERLMNFLFEDEDWFRQMICSSTLIEYSQMFPEYAARFIEFARGTEARFKHYFGSFHKVYRMGEAFPNAHYEEELFTRLLADDVFLRSHVNTASDLFFVYNKNPDHGLRLAARLLELPDVVFRMGKMPNGLKKLSEHGSFNDLRDCFMSQIYFHLDTLKSMISNWGESRVNLNTMMAAVPDHAQTLQFYHHLLCQKKSLATIAKEFCNDEKMITELTHHLERQTQANSLTIHELKPLQKQLNALVYTKEKEPEPLAALTELRQYVGQLVESKTANPSPQDLEPPVFRWY